jgi:Protein of unknown function (DUF3040)
MALDHDEFLRLSQIAESLRRSDPQLARKLAAPVRRRSLWTVLCYITLSVFALVALTGVAVGDSTRPSSAIAKSALHRGERSAASRARVRTQIDWQPAGRHAPPTRFPANYGAEAP